MPGPPRARVCHRAQVTRPASLSPSTFRPVAELAERGCDVTVYESGWQSWSPAGAYPGDATGPRPARDRWQLMAFRPDRPAPASGFQGEGLLAVGHADGTTTTWAAPDPTRAVPSIRLVERTGRLVVSADGEVEERRWPVDLPTALGRWADELAARLRLPPVRSLPPLWCSWYHYWGQVTQRDVEDNLAAFDRLELDVGVVQVDDGHQAEIGDWVERSPRFRDLRELAARVRGTGRRAGVWTAPLLVGERSALAARHPDWLLGGPDGPVLAATHWNQQVFALDVTRPEVEEHLTGVFRTLCDDGFDLFKIDFLYAGALPGRRHGDADPVAAYRHALALVRQAVGPDRTVLGCGAPLLPSLGLVDAMRVSPDVDATWDPPHGDVSQPSGLGALAGGRARGFQHGRFWVNDPDCLLARPQVAFRDELAEHVRASGGLVGVSDAVLELDPHGLDLVRAALGPSAPTPPRWVPGGHAQGRLVREEVTQVTRVA